MTHRIGVIGGDGIGPEVLAEALRSSTPPAWPTTAPTTTWAHRYLADGTVLPDGCLRSGAGSTPCCSARSAIQLRQWPGPDWSSGILLRMRFDLDQYINLRPFRLPPKADFEVIRENTGGTYAGEGGSCAWAPNEDRHPGLGQHPPRRRALRPLRVPNAPRPPIDAT